MNGNMIYLLLDDGQISEMKQEPFPTEDFLQHLLAMHPQLLASDQYSTAPARRYLPISREMGLASEENGGERWVIDHLFVDQDAVLTLVEVKRSSDTRIRREVVGQMLDYASNAVLYLPIEKIRARFEQSHDEPEERLHEFLNDDVDYELFWETVKTNLLAHRIRLVFLANEIPQELRRIIEFLNGNMSTVEVFGVEVKQYVNSTTGLKTLVPRVIGQTTEAQRTKRNYSSKTSADLGEVRESMVVQLSDSEYRIEQYTSGTIRIRDLNNPTVEPAALPTLKRVILEKALPVTETNSNGNPRNTRQLGELVIRALKGSIR